MRNFARPAFVVAVAAMTAVAATTLARSGPAAGPLAAADQPRSSAAAPYPAPPGQHDSGAGRAAAPTPAAGGQELTLAFAGDVHFQLHLAAMLRHPRGALGPITRTLAGADLAMVNLETAITERGTRLHRDYAFRTSPEALDVLAAAGVDVVTMANNHGVDYGPVGLADTLRAVRRSPVAVVGIGADSAAALTPYRATVRGTRIAVFAASAEPDQLRRSAAGPGKAGIAAVFSPRPAALLAAVRAASDRGELVVVYLHWGTERQNCPDARQPRLAQALSAAGADVVVGAHAHVLLGGGWLGDTYVDYGLGNFVWYHDRQPETGVLVLRVRGGSVVSDTWVPARIDASGRPLPVHGHRAEQAVADWRRLRGCATLRPRPAALPQREPVAALPPYASSVSPIAAPVRARMRYSHHVGCPVPVADLRYLRMSYVDMAGQARTGEMVVAARWAQPVTRVFARLYAARWPIHQMRLVDDFGGNDARSMAADNTSGYNCRRVAGETTWSAHAYGAAIDLNPVRNPYLSAAGVQPPAGRPFVTLDRSGAAQVPPGTIRADDVVVRAFASIGWAWGGSWHGPKDFQHFSVSGD